MIMTARLGVHDLSLAKINLHSAKPTYCTFFTSFKTDYKRDNGMSLFLWSLFQNK